MTMTTTELYEFEALDADGTRTSGTVTAESAEGARARVAATGAWVTRVEVQGRALTFAGGVATGDLALFFELLAGLLEAGLSLPRAILALADLAPSSTRPLAVDAARDINEGRSLAAALERSRAVTAEVATLIRAGEASGALAVSVRSAASLLSARAARQRALQAALAYPVLLLLSTTAALIVMVAFVLPRLTAMLAELGQQLPPLTRGVVMGAHAVELAFIPAVLLIVLAAIALRFATQSADGRLAVHRALRALPGIGPVRLAIASSRLSTTLGTLLAQGLPIKGAMQLAGVASGDAWAMRAAQAATEAVLRGERPSRALSTHGAVTRRAAHLLSAGEESGRLADLALRAGQLDAEWVDQRIAFTMRVIEPVLILVFAGVVGLFAAAMLQAVYAIRPTA